MSSKNAPVFRTLNVNVFPGGDKITYQNAITTTKYTWYTWLPKSVFDQFRRIANVYFLLISILMLIGTYATYLWLTPLDPYSTVGTLLFVLLVTSIKEGAEDLQRARSDTYENNKSVNVITFDADGREIETVKKSQEVKPGDIIKLKGQTQVPVDMLLVLTSMHEDGNKCYIETANIDGETNLKVKEAPAMLLDVCGPAVAAGKAIPELFNGLIEFEGPNKNIHNFVGTFKLAGVAEAIPLSTENLVLRSSLFSNTEWGYGIAVYTGQETKIQMNNRHAPSKMSRLEKNLNTAIIIIFCAQVVLVSMSVISIYIMGFNNLSKLPYVYPPGVGNDSILPLWLEQWFVFFLLYNNFIPISLYVTIELVNVGQAFLIAADEQMYREELNVACVVRASNLVQELGMVSNIFSDKTGTLTRNEMKLVKFVVNGVIYDIVSDSNATAARPSSAMTTDGKVYDIEKGISDLNQGNLRNSPSSKSVGDMSPKQILNQLPGFDGNMAAFAEFFRCLTACHTVVREKDGTYRAESPDELALVEGVAGYRCHLLERGTKEMLVEILGEKKTFEVLAVNPFNADRKRMSLLCRDTASRKYFVMCKGADNIMLPLCSIPPAELTRINQNLLDLANMGLRTLVIAQKELEDDAAVKWLARYKEAATSTVNREENIAAAGAELEKGMKLLGITAIEDRLQDEVPEVIADLAKAGIILWMLTGDKLETAINIGHSCNLLLDDTEVLMLTKIGSAEEFASRLREVHAQIVKDPTRDNVALVIDGPSFTHFGDKDTEQRAMLLRVGQGCRSVIACRLTPTQKKELVNLVKTESKPKATTLAIGDGANDVSMILEGDVGVGIFGKEGRQAANNADFAIGEFKFLRRLLLVHGRWNYVRQSKVFLYSMHKNMVLTLTLFWYSYYDAVSGTSPYESWVYTGFNFILGLPIIFFGMMDRDISADFALKYPQTYSTGRLDTQLNTFAIAKWIWNACLYSMIICLLAYVVVIPTFEAWSLYEAGTTVFVGLCMALQLKVAFFHHQWNYIHCIAMFISVFGMFIYFLVIADIEDDYWNVAAHTYEQTVFWFYGFFTIPLVAILIDVVGYNLYFFFWPTREILFREIEINQMTESPAASAADAPASAASGGGNGGVSKFAAASTVAPSAPSTAADKKDGRVRKASSSGSISFTGINNNNNNSDSGKSSRRGGSFRKSGGSGDTDNEQRQQQKEEEEQEDELHITNIYPDRKGHY